MSDLEEVQNSIVEKFKEEVAKTAAKCGGALLAGLVVVGLGFIGSSALNPGLALAIWLFGGICICYALGLVIKLAVLYKKRMHELSVAAIRDIENRKKNNEPES